MTYVSFPAWDGLMGVQPQRAPLVAKLGDGVLRLDYPQGGQRYFFIAGGFAQMKDNQLSLLTTEAIPAEQIVHQEALEGLKQAEASKASTAQEVAERTRRIERAQTLLQLVDKAGQQG